MPATPPNSPPRTQAALTSPSRASVTEALAASPPKCGSSFLSSPKLGPAPISSPQSTNDEKLKPISTPKAFSL